MTGSTLRRLAPSAAAWVRQPVWADTVSPAEHPGWREETTVATASPGMTAPRGIGGAYDSRSSIRPRVYGSRDRYSTRSRTCPRPGVGIAVSSRRKSASRGFPSGRAARRIWLALVADISLTSEMNVKFGSYLG